MHTTHPSCPIKTPQWGVDNGKKILMEKLHTIQSCCGAYPNKKLKVLRIEQTSQQGPKEKVLPPPPPKWKIVFVLISFKAFLYFPDLSGPSEFLRAPWGSGDLCLHVGGDTVHLPLVGKLCR